MNMKKSYIIAFLCGMSFVQLVAQDTVHYGDSCYLFNTLNLNNIRARNNHEAAGVINGFLNDGGYKYSLQEEIYIYGIAATIRRSPIGVTDSAGYNVYLYSTDSAGYTVYLYTTLNGTDLVLIDSATIYSREIRYVYMAMYGNNVVRTAVPCYEYYFSKPHSLQGTIYIGSKEDPNHFVTNNQYPYLCVAVDYSFSQHWIILDTNSPIESCEDLSLFWGGYFPIIQPERIECPAVMVEVTERWEDHAVLEWDMEGDSCQLSITPYGMPIDSGIVVGLQVGSYTATDLDSGVYYVARLKTLCHHHCPIHADMPVWSDWGSPTIIPLGNQGINTAKNTPKWSLTPNPAHGSVTVQCDEGIKSVELLSVKGETVHRRNAAGAQSCTLDITGMAKGIYIVQITTPQGTAARKLAVE